MIYVLLIIILSYLIFNKFSDNIKEHYSNNNKLSFDEKINALIRDKNKEEHFYSTYLKMKELFKFFDISYVANGGTLLGAYRDGKFLAWDYDMDFCVNFKNNNKILSKSFKKKAKELGLEYKYYNTNNKMWGGIGGLKFSNKGKWDMGQIDIFFFSNSYDDNIFYLGNDGKPHIWENKHFRKENLFPLKFIEFKFPTIEKIVEIPSPRNAEPELIRHFGNDFKHSVPKEYELWYKIDNLLY